MEWLLAYAGVKRRPEEWAKLLNVKITDPKGWTIGRPFEIEVGLTGFIKRLKDSEYEDVSP